MNKNMNYNYLYKTTINKRVNNSDGRFNEIKIDYDSTRVVHMSLSQNYNKIAYHILCILLFYCLL